MIVPMKKVSLIVLEHEKQNVLKELRRLGLLHIEIKEGSGARLQELGEQTALLERSVFAIAEKADAHTVQKEADVSEAIAEAKKIQELMEEKKACLAEKPVYEQELDRLKPWGEFDPSAIAELTRKGIQLFPCEMSPAEYQALGETVTTLVMSRTKDLVRFALIQKDGDPSEEADQIRKQYQIALPQMSTTELRSKISLLEKRIQTIDEELTASAGYIQSMKQALTAVKKEIEFETYSTGMTTEDLSVSSDRTWNVAYFTGYIPTEDLSALTDVAREHAWGVLVEDPTEEDHVPTKLKNNKFVSLVYPLTDFLGTVPGYFEMDISSWFLGFIMIFFGIIFGDGGYGLLITGVAVALIVKSRMEKKEISPMFLLLALLGGATILWGVVTCTWFGLDPALLPAWLRNLSIPVLSNVYSDRLWYPFWTNGEAGLTTSQNVQIFCFTLAVIHLVIAHGKVALGNLKSLKVLGDIGSIMQLVGMFYVVLSLVVNGEVFGLGLVIAGIPVGTVSIVLVGVGFVLNFVFGNYEGSVGASVMASVKDIVSMLLGVVNVFADIVSYIRLWAVGMAGAAISATVNDMAAPMLGNVLFIVFVVILLVFGHGLNMILNVLSVIVHGIRLNTLEFSGHVGVSWSGHKYEPFK